MPRSARRVTGKTCYHVLNRGNRRADIFHKDADYRAFLDLMAEAWARVPVSVLAYCLMPNHFHFVVQPRGDADLGRWMHRLFSTHVRRYNAHYDTRGRLWQDRYKSFPVQTNGYLLRVLRYVERNPVRAGLVAHAADWHWSSAYYRTRIQRPVFLREPAIGQPDGWGDFVDGEESEEELTRLRHCCERGCPFGDDRWVRRTVQRLGLESTLNGRGRPPKRLKKDSNLSC